MARTFRTSFFACAIVALFAMTLALAGCSGSSSSASSNASSSASSSESSSVSSSASSSISSTSAESSETSLAPGTYEAKFDTDSSMFHVNEANKGMGELTVAQDGSMTIHVSLVSKKILNLFPGTAEEAQQPGAELLEPTLDTVTYSDGATEEVYGFDVPVPVLDEEFDLAIIGEKGEWYDHKVSVSSPSAQ